MDPNLVEKILEISGQAGLLWLALFFLVRTLKEQYEKRIDALEKAAQACEEDRRALHEKIQEILSER
ncbi:MAG: hypothetical protein AAGB14_00395 [Verrucomicrobiota bacterium]